MGNARWRRLISEALAVLTIWQRDRTGRVGSPSRPTVLTRQPRYSRRAARRSAPSAPESAHQQRGGSPRRTEHWLSVAEGNCVVERRGGKQPEANNQSIIKKMMNSIRPDALASLLGKGEAQNGKLPGKGERQQSDTEPRRDSERGKWNAWGGWR
jgi:hypothetical protein